MSLNRIGTGALRIAQQVASRVVNHNGTWLLKIVPRLRPPNAAAVQAVVRAAAVPRQLSRNPLMRMIQMTIRHSRHIARPLSNIVMNHRTFFGLDQRPRYVRRQFLFKKPRTDFGIVERVRDLFGTKERYNEHLKKSTLPDRLSAYDIGGNIGYGCNAAVYALRLQSDGPGAATPSTTDKDLKAYPLALKLMFNYEHDRRNNEDGLWSGMGAELAPFPKAAALLKGRMGDFRPLPASHPNIVHVGTAFVDSMPILPDAKQNYPMALPTAVMYDAIEPDPKTLFIVMRRYRLTLQAYLREQPRVSLWARRALVAQLMEGCVFLYKHKVAQRDMKSDNILLSYDNDGEIPQLVISDFGCALANGSFIVDYRHEGMDLGGNLRTRAPEIASALPPSMVDFSMADTWAAGALSYEIFTKLNPFYSVLSSSTYKEYELPILSDRIPEPTRKAVAAVMRRDPKERLPPSIAANVFSLSLFRFGADLHELLPSFASEPLAKEIRKVSKRVERVIDDMISLLAAETISARITSRDLITRAELQLRATFMARLDRDELWASLAFFRETPSPSDTSGCESDVESAV
ncbi:pink-1 [Pristionchus pacificus]|uniref:non-specific serine/threonine protein kinase n=1 Tax=Pristionchus pacificus TaxID=54126 RepID=A0A454XLI5_PRIPA|nr:pink-1 [Pristionchus pacificus]|eukprot:PDM82952.1 pink-1 [Pristionchus pacificus]